MRAHREKLPIWICLAYCALALRDVCTARGRGIYPLTYQMLLAYQILLFLSAAAAGLGNSLDSISVLTVIYPALARIALARLLPPEVSTVSSQDGESQSSTATWIMFILVQSVGFTIGFATALAPDMSPALSVALVWFFGLLIWTVMALLVFLPSHRMRQRLRNSSARAYVFPLLHSTVSIVVLGRLISTFPCPANAVLDIGPLRMLASVFGLMGVEWFLSMTSVLIFENVLDSVEHQTTQDCSRSSRSASLRRRVSHLVCAHLAALLVLGGLLTRSTSFWQIPTAQQLATPASSSAPPSIAVSCLLNQRGKQIDDKEDWKWLLDQTAIRVAAGDDIILWSEEAAQLYSEAEEALILGHASGLIRDSNATYIGLNYFKRVGPPGNWSNVFVLLSPGGAVVWNKAKSFPVPFVESDTKAGPATLPMHQASFGKLSGATCFDLDHPYYIRAAGREHVDVFLQPSWTWGAIGMRHFQGDRVRAIENGFTLLRCSSDGVSAVVSPLGETIAFTLDTAGPQVILWPSIPTTPHVPTLYPYIGFTLEITCLALSFLVWVCALADENWVRATLVNYGIRDAEESESELAEKESRYSRVEQDAERASLVADSHVPADRRL